MPARIVPLGSGSQGNSTFVEIGGASLLVDAGLSARALTTRLRSIGVNPAGLRVILLSHEHHDHASGAERFSRQHDVPVACTGATLDAMDLAPRHLAGWQRLESGCWVDFEGFQVHAFPVPHDAAEPVGFVVRANGVRLGVATDLGHATPVVAERLRGCNALMIESNHDTGMLLQGPYPWRLKQRVSGRMGHLSNSDAASLLREVTDDRCRAVLLAHLSAKNNTPDLALRSAKRALGARRETITLRVAERGGPTEMVEF